MKQLLLENWLLRDLTPEEATKLSLSIERVRMIASQPILTRAQKNDSLWIVATGDVAVIKPFTEGPNFEVVAKLGSGDLFGEMSWLDGRPVSTSVVAVGEVELLRLKFIQFDQFLWNSPDAHIGILRKFAVNLCHRLRAN